VILPSGIITAAIETLQSGRLTPRQRRAAMLLGGGGSVQKGPAKRLELPGKTKSVERAGRRERMAKIRATVMERAGGLCELCGAPASEAHHLLSGPLRRARESVDTVIALCMSCHRQIHGNDLAALYHAQSYCVSSGMHEAGAALARRIDKLEEARASLGKERVTR
jgi:5-methylcytosine-specific restriction endonuclease McrA